MSAVYEIAISVFHGAAGVPDPNLAYAILKSGGTSVDWPKTLTSISIAGKGVVNPITPIARDLYQTATSATVTGTGTFGQYLANGIAAPWPAGFTGPITIASSSTATSISTPSSTQATPTPGTSVTSGGTTTTTSNTETVTSNRPTSTPKAPSAVSPSSSGISTGAVAGIAIGCAFVGLVIGLLAASCLFRRKAAKRGKTLDHAAIHDELEVYPSGKGAPINDMQLSQFLLEPTPDRDVAQETQSIGALIDQHVESYYHHHPIAGDQRAPASALADLGFPFSSAASLDAQGATALCLDPRSRQVGLRHVIMRVLLSSIDVHSSQGPSMLPAPVASFLRAIPPAESDRLGDPQAATSLGTNHHQPAQFETKAGTISLLSRADNNLAANELALRKWRKLSAFLLHPARSQRTPLPTTGDATVEAQAQELARSLNTFLRFFVDE
ncbi:hypothetical protein BBAD15_g5052 [Beauveria bassiana D1-5]|uniref:Uncharacterized protein n=1 Tax=Beauveria bassiana D1-5 TaxID=1245745 RepID=A0A0A2VTE6_BEABA|nr:hypothetical protein BBAD15_g5052 [Beauveria bassiana D1-5]